MSSQSGMPGFDPQEAARLAMQVQDLGFDAARMVVDRFAEMFQRFRSQSEREGGGPGVRLTAGDGGYQQLQSDVRRALDGYLSLLRRLNDMSLGFFDSRREGTEAQPLTLPAVSPGGRSSARMWLQNTTPSAVNNMRVWSPRLVSHTGATIPESSLTFSPPEIQRLDPGETVEVLAVAQIPEESSTGIYHGMVLVERLPDLSMAVSLSVVAAPGPQ